MQEEEERINLERFLRKWKWMGSRVQVGGLALSWKRDRWETRGWVWVYILAPEVGIAFYS